MDIMVSKLYLTFVLLLKLASQTFMLPVNQESDNSRPKRQVVDSRMSEVHFRIKGVSRGMLEVSRSDDSIFVSEWQSGITASSSFTFCHAGNVISEIGHVSVMEVCQAGSPHKKLVLDTLSRRVFVRQPLPTDEVLEAVIYEHQHFFLRPSEHHQQILVSELEGTVGMGATAQPQIHGHVQVVMPVHLADIENRGDKNARWEIRVSRNSAMV